MKYLIPLKISDLPPKYLSPYLIVIFNGIAFFLIKNCYVLLKTPKLLTELYIGRAVELNDLCNLLGESPLPIFSPLELSLSELLLLVENSYLAIYIDQWWSGVFRWCIRGKTCKTKSEKNE